MTLPPSILDARQSLPAPASPSAALGAVGQPPLTRSLELVVEPQAQSEWCWAAISASVARFYEAASPWTQCTVVTRELGQGDCCTDGASATCNRPYVLESALTLVDHLERDFAGPLTFAAIVAEVDAGRPVGLCIDWTGGGGHFVTVAGYDPKGELVEVKDSLFGTSQQPLSTFPARYKGGGTWSWTYLTRPREGEPCL